MSIFSILWRPFGARLCSRIKLGVLKTLRAADINIVVIHQHMTGENPRMIFLHYYGRGKALALAEGVKSAIETQPLAANK
jgi:hypothetical protein